jgi:hypothetical protein
MTGCLPVGTDRDAGSTVCEVSGGWWVVARTVRWIVLEWVDRGGREKERGNGRRESLFSFIWESSLALAEGVFIIFY